MGNGPPPPLSYRFLPPQVTNVAALVAAAEQRRANAFASSASPAVSSASPDAHLKPGWQLQSQGQGQAAHGAAGAASGSSAGRAPRGRLVTYGPHTGGWASGGNTSDLDRSREMEMRERVGLRSKKNKKPSFDVKVRALWSSAARF